MGIFILNDKITNSKQTVKIKSLNDGSKIFIADSPANNIPGSFSRYEKKISTKGITISYTKTTYAPNGNIVHVKNKMSSK